MHLAQTTRLRQTRSQLQAMTAGLLQHSPRPRLRAAMLDNRHFYVRLAAAMKRRIERADASLRQVMQALHALSPLSTLERGYAIVQKTATGAIVTEAASVQAGERVQARLAHGYLDCLVEKTREN
jgi:exodeoxyribonuclease VII large subunit